MSPVRRDRLHDAFHVPGTPEYDRVSRWVWAAIVLSGLVLVVDLNAPLEGWIRTAVVWVDRALIGVFALEYALRLWTFRPPELEFWTLSPPARLRARIWGRVRFALRPMMLVDLITLVGVVPALRGLRALRFLRLLRTRQLLRYANPFDGVARALEENAALYAFGLSTFAGSVLLGALTFFLSERGANERIATFPDALWWSIVTITTVGYGDLTPVTQVGRVVAGALMISGMVTLALFAGIVGSSLMGAVATLREETFRMSGYLDHVVLCGYEPGARMLLDALRAEIDFAEHPVVIFAPGERPIDVPPEFLWVRGDPTKESELDKVRIGYARAVVVVGSRSELPQHSDARTILVTFTIRRYLKQLEKLELRRKKPLYIVAEILDSENVDHARTAGANEVIETNRLGFSLLAHAIEEPGTGTVLSELADKSGHSLFVGRCPSGVQGTFREVAVRLKESRDILVIGVHDPKAGDLLNPADDLPVVTGTPLIYVARGPELE